MSKLPSNLPALLRAAGLRVVEIDGWQDRGRPASTGGFEPVGVLNHHTGASAKGWSLAQELAYAKWMFLTGRPDLPAPLVQIALGRSATVYLGAAGRANHAGTAKASGSVAGGDGNSLYSGIEWMLSGTEPIPVAMMRAGVTLNAVLTEKVVSRGKGSSVRAISCHYQTSVTGKWDIGDPSGVLFNGKRVLDVNGFRADVAVERARLYHAKPVKPEKKVKAMRAVVINVPVKVGATAWTSCWTKAYRRGAVFGLNETFTKAQRRTYAALMKKKGGMRQYGLHRTPNPIFWRTSRFDFVSGKVHVLHPKAPGALARRYPGFNDSRTLNEVVLGHKTDGREIAILNAHFVPNGGKVNDAWRKVVRARSISVLRSLVRKHQKAGREVIFMGDTNIASEFKMPLGFRWYRGKGIDKMGGTLQGTARTFPAPTDHKHGVVSRVILD